jgi:peptidylprolyl isomerase
VATLPTAMRRLLTVIPCAVLLAACGGSSKKDETAATPTKTAKPAATAAAPVGKVKVTGALGAKPKIVVTPINATPPANLKIKDLAKGHGKAAKAGDTVTVQYDGALFQNGTEFDASWDRGQPFSFPLGAGQVIPGWDKGVAGMKVGGRRVLTIPPNLGYGPQGQGPIPPNATLVFVVDLLKIK